MLEDYLDSFQGAIIAVSHDRYFLDRITRHLFAIEQGQMVPYIGGYQSYLDAHAEDASRQSAPEKAPQEKPQAPKRTATKDAPRFSFREQRDFETIEATIAGLEDTLTQLGRELDENAENYTRVTELMARQEETQKALDEAMERWMYLQDKWEQIQQWKK